MSKVHVLGGAQTDFERNWTKEGKGMVALLKEAVADAEGKVRMKRWLPIGITADERVCSGAHYGRFFADMKRYLDHPELLTEPPEKVRFDGDYEYHEPKAAQG